MKDIKQGTIGYLKVVRLDHEIKENEKPRPDIKSYDLFKMRTFTDDEIMMILKEEGMVIEVCLS